MFSEKGVLKISSKFSGEHPCRSVVSIKLLCKATLLKSHLSMGIPSHFIRQLVKLEYRDKSARYNYRATEKEGRQNGDTTLYILRSSYPFHRNNFKLCYLLGSK